MWFARWGSQWTKRISRSLSPLRQPRRSKSFLKKNNLVGKRLIAVHPGSHPNLAYKRWPLERFVETLRRLQEQEQKKTPIHPLVVGGADEKELAEELIQHLGNGTNTAGLFAVEETAVLLKQCDALLTNDSGVNCT